MTHHNYMILEFDLAGAEWVVVAYLTGDRNMIEVVQSGKSPHVVTGALISGASEELVEAEHKLVKGETDPGIIEELREKLPELYLPGIFLPRTMSIRQAGKKSNHGLNYDMKYKRFALENEMPEGDAQRIEYGYKYVAYPMIPEWHKSIQRELRQHDRTLYNCFGRKVRLLGEWGTDLFDAAYSFKPQSTVTGIALKGMVLAYHDDDPFMQLAELLTHTHDSDTFQYPIGRWEEMAHFVKRMMGEHMRPELTYDPYHFCIDVGLKVGLSWGRTRELPVKHDWSISDIAGLLESIYSELVQSDQTTARLMQDVLESDSESEEGSEPTEQPDPQEWDQELEVTPVLL